MAPKQTFAQNLVNPDSLKTPNQQPVSNSDNRSLPPSQEPKMKIGKNFLQQVRQKASANNESEKAIELTQDIANELFEQFRQTKRAANLMTVVSQLAQVAIGIILPDEIQLICTTGMSQIFANGIRDEFLELGRSFTKIKSLKVKVCLDESKIADLPEQPKILTRSEIFEQMVSKNPNLKVLKDALNLNIE